MRVGTPPFQGRGTDQNAELHSRSNPSPTLESMGHPSPLDRRCGADYSRRALRVSCVVRRPAGRLRQRIRARRPMPKVSGRAKPARSQTAKTTRAATVAGRANGDVRWLTIRGAAHNNLKDIDANFPLGRFVCVTGVSGSGKSSLVNDILYKALARDLNGATTLEPAPHAGLDGLDALDKIISIDQSPIGRTPRSNPATYIKVFDEIRQLFAKLPDAKLRGYQPGRFSFNVAGGRRGGGRCEACEGNGANKIEMDFLADVWVRCPICEGKRFGRETLQIQYKHKSIADVLEMDVQEALEHFENVPRVRAMLQTLHDVGLDYIKLGQASTTLSGGEAQRIKLARELVKKPTGETLYVLDEPTTGLHFDDIRKLLGVLHGFVDAGNTVVVIEHNLDVVKVADHIIDLGPEGGADGGFLIAAGTPEAIMKERLSETGRVLRAYLKPGRKAGKPARRRAASGRRRSRDLRIRGARLHNLKNIDVVIPKDKLTVITGVSGSGKTSLALDTIFA
ncbi:MAG: ATP-binding cassette domain-containing protein, partial [Planctomycetes bacterium]|nr:ATP-binding cassette domain-containing protein [Planctomycetota bacterium]